MLPCTRRVLLLLVAAEEARVRTVWGRGRCTAETADSDDLSGTVDVVGTLSPVLAVSVEVSRRTIWHSESTAFEDPASRN